MLQIHSIAGPIRSGRPQERMPTGSGCPRRCWLAAAPSRHPNRVSWARIRINQIRSPVVLKIKLLKDLLLLDLLLCSTVTVFTELRAHVSIKRTHRHRQIDWLTDADWRWHGPWLRLRLTARNQLIKLSLHRIVSGFSECHWPGWVHHDIFQFHIPKISAP